MTQHPHNDVGTKPITEVERRRAAKAAQRLKDRNVNLWLALIVGFGIALLVFAALSR